MIWLSRLCVLSKVGLTYGMFKLMTGVLRMLTLSLLEGTMQYD